MSGEACGGTVYEKRGANARDPRTERGTGWVEDRSRYRRGKCGELCTERGGHIEPNRGVNGEDKTALGPGAGKERRGAVGEAVKVLPKHYLGRPGVMHGLRYRPGGAG